MPLWIICAVKRFLDYNRRLLLRAVMDWADCARGCLAHSCLLNSCLTSVDGLAESFWPGLARTQLHAPHPHTAKVLSSRQTSSLAMIEIVCHKDALNV